MAGVYDGVGGGRIGVCVGVCVGVLNNQTILYKFHLENHVLMDLFIWYI